MTAPENRKEEKEALKAEVRSDVGNVVERLSELQGDSHIYPIVVLLVEAICIGIRLISGTFFQLLSSAISAFTSLVASALFSSKIMIIAALRFYTAWLLVLLKFLWRI